MARFEYEFGDQVEARLLISWTPGETGLVGRTFRTVYRGDVPVDQSAGTKAYLETPMELLAFAQLWAVSVRRRYLTDVATPEALDEIDGNQQTLF